MKINLCYLFVFLLSHTILSSQNIIGYERDGGIMFEKYSCTTNPFIYSYDNKIYTPNQKFVYSYLYKKDSSLFYFKCVKDSKWEFVDGNIDDNSVNSKIYFEIIADSSKMGQYSKGNNGQSVLRYYYYDNNRLRVRETTGLVENSLNIWMHPPRSLLFSILELNPFPYVKFPIRKGRKWSWKLEIGSQWGDPRWKIWDGSIVNHYKYRIVRTSMNIHTSFGVLPCAVIESSAHSRIGKTKAVFYFNEQFGFVKCEYTNIDDSEIVLELIELIK